MKPFPVILSSPSGGGKTTIARAILNKRRDVGYSVSCTTRKPRPGEVDGVDYFFLTHDEFALARKRGELAESAEVHGEMYGTLRREVQRVLSSGQHVIMDIDVQGASQLAEAFQDAVLIFVMPPSAEVLIQRLRKRGTEEKNRIIRRLETAVEEFGAVSMYHYIVVNDRLEAAVDRVGSIIDAEAAGLPRAEPIVPDVESIVKRLQEEIRNQRES